MGFWKQFIGYIKRENVARTRVATVDGGLLQWNGGRGAAMCVSTVYRCVRLLSESVANLPLQYMRLKGGVFVADAGGRLDYLLNVQPDVALSAFDFWRQVVVNVLLDGNAYIVPVYSPATMGVDRLALCGRGTVSHDTVNDTYAVSDIVNGVSGVFGESEVIHIKGMTVGDYKSGVSVLTYARLTAEIVMAGDRETRNRFENGGNVRGLVMNERSTEGFGEYADEELARIASAMNAGLNGGGRIMSLPGSLDFKQLSLSSVDMQFLESRKFTVREICRFFGVHPSFVFDDTSNNYKSAEQANVAFLSHTLNPLLRNIENELQRKLTAPSLCAKRRFQFDRRALYACDLEGMMKYRGQLLQCGTTVNELRLMDNRPAVEGGDQVLVSANLKEIGMMNQESGIRNDEKE